MAHEKNHDHMILVVTVTYCIALESKGPNACNRINVQTKKREETATHVKYIYECMLLAGYVSPWLPNTGGWAH